VKFRFGVINSHHKTICSLHIVDIDRLHICADILLDKEEITAAEIWDIYNKAPRIQQVFLEFRKRLMTSL
jgi:hypothetical protein